MKREYIIQVAIGENGRLFVRPHISDFSKIFRTASGVSWDAEKCALVGSEPREWSVSRWFEEILASAASEYGVALRLTPFTQWSDVDGNSQREMELYSASDWPSQFLARQKENSARNLNDLLLEQALSQASPLWADGRFADYVRVLAPHRDRLSPAQIKRLAIAERRSKT